MAASSRLRVFLDTNVLVSALLSPNGAPARILRLHTEGHATVLLSPQVLDETDRTIRNKLPHALPALRRALTHVPPEVTVDPAPEEITRWSGAINPDDAAILAAAMKAHADFLVTGDRHFLDNPTLARESGLRIVTPAQFMELADVP